MAAMAETTETTVIDRATHVRGRVTGMGDLEIAGHIEGEIACSGEALVDTSGLVAANINARRIVVRGAVKGDLVADELVHIEAGAKVVGNLRAPRIAIAHGGLVRGQVQATAPAALRPAVRTAAANASLRAAAPAAALAPAAREARAAVPAPPPTAREIRSSAGAPMPAPAKTANTSTIPIIFFTLPLNNGFFFFSSFSILTLLHYSLTELGII